jgi:hypothetical protein
MLGTAMPYFTYDKLTDADAEALATYQGPQARPASRAAMVGASEKSIAPYLTLGVPETGASRL